MKSFYYHLKLIPAIMLSMLLGAQFTAQAQTGFTVGAPTLTQSGGNTIIVWQISQNKDQKTGLSHFIIQNFCLPTGNYIKAENSSDNVNWTTISTTLDDGSTKGCQTNFGNLLKFSGSSNVSINYYRLTLKGSYDLVDGFSIIKYGNGPGKNNDESCNVVATKVPKLSLPSNFEAVSQIYICDGSSTSLSATYNNAISYTWYKDNVVIAGQTGPTLSNVTQAGNYSVTCTLNDCNQISQEFTVTVKQNPSFTVKDGAVCLNGSLALSDLVTSGSTSGEWAITSGTASLSNGILTATNLNEITLSYTVSDNSNSVTCSTTKSVKVTVKPLPTVSVTASQSVCPDTEVTLEATGTSTSYSWSPGGQTTSSIKVTPSETTTYVVTGTLDGCTKTASSTVTVKPLPTVSISGSQTICAGESTTLTASGATTYVWSPGGQTSAAITVSPTVNTTYSVVGTSNGCIGSNSVLVTVKVKPTVSVSADNSSVCSGNKVVLTARGTFGSTYNWGGISAATTSTIEVYPTATTTYSVTASLNGCTSESASVTVTVTECIRIATYTQGFYGNSGGKTCDGKSTAYLLSSAFNGLSQQIFGLTSTNRSFTLKSTDMSSNIYKMLPGSGTPSALNTGSWSWLTKGEKSPLNEYGRIVNNLLSQTISLWFNIRTSGNLGGFVMTKSFTTAKYNCLTGAISNEDKKTFNVTSKLVGKSVNQLLDLANKALGGGLNKYDDPSLSEIYATVDLINNAFDQGRAVVTSINSESSIVTKPNDVFQMSKAVATQPVLTESITAYPNPFQGTVTIKISPKIPGKASLDIYDMSGLKVATLFNGELMDGEDKKFEFSVPSGRGVQTYIYYFVQGDQIIQGKLIGF